MGFFDGLKRFLSGNGWGIGHQSTVHALASPGSPPSEASLDRVFAGAARVRILNGGVSGSKPMGKKALLVIREVEIAELRECLRIGDTGFHCMCSGSEAIEISDQEGVRAVLGLHHGQSIRWVPEWTSDAMLADGLRLMRWLSAHGVDGPLGEHEAAVERSNQSRRAFLAWKQAMPECLESISPELISSADPFGGASGVAKQALDVLRAASSSETAAILALVAWFGHGEGIWSGYPSYESVPEIILLEFSTASIVGALASRELTPQELAGASRLLAGPKFDQARPGDRARVPQALRRRLRAHVEASPIDDNRIRYAAAFPRD